MNRVALLALILVSACGPSAAVPDAAAGASPTAGRLPASGPVGPTVISLVPTATPVPPTSVPARQLTGDTLAAALKASGMPITEIVIYTPESDPNKLLGRPGQYVAKVNWRDQRTEPTPFPTVSGFAFPTTEPTPPDATIEVFPDDATLRTRQEYTEAISKSSPLLLQYIYANTARRALMRLPKDFTPDQAQAYQAWLATL